MWYKMAKDEDALIQDKKLVSCVIVFKKVDEKVHVLIEKKDFNKWAIPGGHVEEDESPEEAAVREIKEETSLTLKPKKLKLVKQHSKSKDDNKVCNIYAYKYKGKEEAKAGSDCDHLEWFEYEKIPFLMWNGNEHVSKAYKMVYK
jgi:ADP-ribose pyrophosphatase YjhB (NUDIX family)